MSTKVSSKREKPTSQVSDDNESPNPTKRQKTDIPTNKSLPDPLNLPAKSPRTWKLASFNVSGLNAAMKKGLKTYLEAEDADIITLQETKVNEPVNGVVDVGKYICREWAFEEKKGYGGVVVFSKIRPISIKRGLPTHPKPNSTRGRIITLEFSTIYYIAVYVPNAGAKLVRLKERVEWDKAMREYLWQLDQQKPIILAGDLNVAHKEIDLARPKGNHKTPGFTPEERKGFETLLNDGQTKFIDTWRHLNPGITGIYTYYSYKFQCRTKGIGWRLDYHVVSERLLERVVASEIRYKMRLISHL
ncbi:hypothetical protein G9A89_018422 [Geosiphon pyriformis]|nr:hypothetical protein G9A89_018422 [Geosiphon pyriformis]